MKHFYSSFSLSYTEFDSVPLSFMAECAREVAQTLCILAAVTEGHTILILHNLYERRTIRQSFQSLFQNSTNFT